MYSLHVGQAYICATHVHIPSRVCTPTCELLFSSPQTAVYHGSLSFPPFLSQTLIFGNVAVVVPSSFPY